MEQILELINLYGLETVVIALMINIGTGLVKIPIKALASRLKDYTKITRFIVFVPIILGYMMSFIYFKYIESAYMFNCAFVRLWLTSSSLSLTFYAIFEKLFPSKKKLLTECEIKTSEAILENIKQLIEGISFKDNASEICMGIVDENKDIECMQAKKIVLRGTQNAVIDEKET